MNFLTKPIQTKNAKFHKFPKPAIHLKLQIGQIFTLYLLPRYGGRRGYSTKNMNQVGNPCPTPGAPQLAKQDDSPSF